MTICPGEIANHCNEILPLGLDGNSTVKLESAVLSLKIENFCQILMSSLTNDPFIFKKLISHFLGSMELDGNICHMVWMQVPLQSNINQLGL